MKTSLHITLLQANLFWQNEAANLNLFSTQLQNIKANQTDIIVLPEMFTSAFTMDAETCYQTMQGKAINWMKQISGDKKAAVCGSLIIKENEKFFNRFVWVQPDGTMHTYDKHHLFRLSNEHKTYTAGTNRIIIQYKDWNICPLICYDIRFPVWCRQQSYNADTFLGEYDILLIVANWPERRNLAWKTLLQARAIENQCFVIATNRVGEDGNGIYHSGDSSIINAMGEILQQVSHDEKIIQQTIEADELIKYRRTYQFWKDADGIQ
jgi:omega-amidase